MDMLVLEDLVGMNEDEVRKHLRETFQAPDAAEGCDILVAYESVGSWGCDSSSFTLMRRQSDGALLENHGSHCSCYGFEGQWEPEETTKEALLAKTYPFYTGGYDDNSDANERAAKAAIESL